MARTLQRPQYVNCLVRGDPAGHCKQDAGHSLTIRSVDRVCDDRDYDRGQLSSLLAGIGVVDRPGVSAALVTLVDVPLVSAATVRAVIESYHRSGATIVRPTSGDRHGHPLLIDRSLFDALRAADPAAGAKPIVRAHASSAGDIAISDEGAFADIDTVEDYRAAIGDRASGGEESV